MTIPGEMILNEPIPLARTANDELERIVGEHARLVYRIAFAVLRNHHDAEDAAQETFLKFLRHRKRWAEIANVRAWLAKRNIEPHPVLIDKILAAAKRSNRILSEEEIHRMTRVVRLRMDAGQDGLSDSDLEIFFPHPVQPIGAPR